MIFHKASPTIWDHAQAFALNHPLGFMLAVTVIIGAIAMYTTKGN